MPRVNVFITEVYDVFRLSKINEDIQRFTSTPFHSKHAIIITYQQFPDYVFQAVIASDGGKTLCILNYDPIPWIGYYSSSSSFRDISGHVGFSEMYCVKKIYAFRSIRKLMDSSNINIAGRHIMLLKPENCRKSGMFDFVCQLELKE